MLAAIRELYKPWKIRYPNKMQNIWNSVRRTAKAYMASNPDTLYGISDSTILRITLKNKKFSIKEIADLSIADLQTACTASRTPGE